MATNGARALNKIFVGNIPWTIGHRELKRYFQEFGRVLSATVVFDKKTGCSKGYGFVIFTAQHKTIYEDLAKVGKHQLEGYQLNIQKTE